MLELLESGRIYIGLDSWIMMVRWKWWKWWLQNKPEMLDKRKIMDMMWTIKLWMEKLVARKLW